MLETIERYARHLSDLRAKQHRPKLAKMQRASGIRAASVGSIRQFSGDSHRSAETPDALERSHQTDVVEYLISPVRKGRREVLQIGFRHMAYPRASSIDCQRVPNSAAQQALWRRRCGPL